MARWQVSTGNPTDNLAEAVEAAGLAEAPIDPYWDKPLKIALIDQAPVLYSLGPDGDDDQASVEVPLVRAPTQDPPDGDIIFKL